MALDKHSVYDKYSYWCCVFISAATRLILYVYLNYVVFCLFVGVGRGFQNIWVHIATVPACSSGTLTNVLPHWNAIPQAQDTTPHPVKVYRYGADLSLCYPLMWNVTLEYRATHFNVLGQTRLRNPSLTLHTHQRTLNSVMLLWR